jgi:tRNA (adenine37-N6)-methyltransferase
VDLQDSSHARETTEFLLRPIGTVLGGREEWVEDDWYGVTATIRLDASRFGPGAVQGLDTFSHLEVVFLFDRVDPAKIRTDPRPARGNPQWPPVGVFAGHGPFRPNRLGVSRCRLLGMDGLDLRVADLDALDGTPVLDIKPYLREFGPVDPVSQPGWSSELMRGYYRAEQ